MVSLRNFIRNDKTLECDFYPEAKETDENKCHIIIDNQTEEIVSFDIPETSECYSMDIGGARTVLSKYINQDEFPEVDYYIWG
nr:MAG TPA: hypothetical protein [Caudoviricetes sp.]